MKEIIRRSGKLLRDPLARNSLALYGVQFCRKIFPLITIPYLTRILQPGGWGIVAFVLSMADLTSLVIEFGFNLSATREISRRRDDIRHCRLVMIGVLGAQVILAAVAISVAAFVSSRIPLLRNEPRLVIAGLFYAIAQGFTPLWFFQGLERLELAAGLEIVAKFGALIAVFTMIKSPQDAWKVLMLQGIAAAISTIVGIILAVRAFGFQAPNRVLVRETLKLGWPMFVFRSAESLYGIGNVFLLGLFAPAPIVGYFATSEKITKATWGLLNPIRESIYPRLSYLVARSQQAAAKLARQIVGVMIVAGVFLSLVLFFWAGWIIKVIAGPAFAPAVSVLRLYSILPAILSITYSVGLQWLIPLGRDQIVNRIILAGGAINLILSFVLAPRFGAKGMAGSVLLAELFVCTSMVWVVWRHTDLWSKTSPFAASPDTEGDPPPYVLDESYLDPRRTTYE